ncbi:MAG: peptidase M6 immune inhibitor A [Sporichthyaceae bacterium]
MRLRSMLALGAATATAVSLLGVPAGAQAAPTSNAAKPGRSDIREIPSDREYRLAPDLQRAQQRRSAARSLQAAGATPAVGTVRRWIALDDFNGRLYRKNYTLRGVGNKVEVWVASDSDDTSTGTAFPAGDCRNNTPNSTDVTDAQVTDLVNEFDTNMFPKESAAFSVAPDRDGSNALITGDYSGGGDKIVTLVDNVRDDNFYDFPAAPTYIAGFFSSQFNDLVDRNVMTIDAFDWLHRTGANPVNAPTADLCSSRPARARLYEGVFAHEYQHLLHSYTDPAEGNFVNEGLSDFAISLVGYGNTLATVSEKGAESHIYCFQGFGTVASPFNPNPRDCGGPQNSLTLWGDEGSGNEILADYGNSWSFMLFLFDRYGIGFMSALHRDGDAQGLASVQAQLDAFAPGTKLYDVVHDFQTMNLLDRALQPGGTLDGYPVSKVTTASLNAAVNLVNPASYAKPGAAPNGADYVQLRKRGKVIPGKELERLTFKGAQTLAPQPLKWTVVNNAPGREGNPTLWSGNESNLDSAAVTQVTVPAGNPTLTFTERHLAEEGYDYAYTAVSTDGGETYTPLANANTVAGPYGPALNGDSATFATQTFDLTPYAGQSILLEFRYVSDGGVNDGGWYVDDVNVGGTLVSDGSSVSPFKSPTQVNPVEVANWNVRLVGLDANNHRAVIRTFDGATSFSLSKQQLKPFKKFPTVIAVVSYDEPSEQVQQYAPYTLTANKVVQLGG